MGRDHQRLAEIVSDETRGAGLAVLTLQPSRVVAVASWKNRDIYVSGPDQMIARTVTELKARGAPEDLIRYDCPLF